MKTTTTLLIIVMALGKLAAQPQDMSARCREEMKKLTYLVGNWKGEAIYAGPNGKQTVAQREHIEWKLQELVLAIDGQGTRKTADGQDEVVFQAFAVVNYDPSEGAFKFKSFMKEGHSTNAYFTILADNRFEWGFDIQSGGKTKYVIELDPFKKTWNEKGQFTRDGIQWINFIELNLIKQ